MGEPQVAGLLGPVVVGLQVLAVETAGPVVGTAVVALVLLAAVEQAGILETAGQQLLRHLAPVLLVLAAAAAAVLLALLDMVAVEARAELVALRSSRGVTAAAAAA
jgi:hypothetical protein